MRTARLGKMKSRVLAAPWREIGRRARMEVSWLLVQQIASMVLMGLAGYGVGKLKLITGEQSRVLSCMCIYLAVPCSLMTSFNTAMEADKLTGLFNSERDNYQKYWDDIHPFVKYGCIRDEKFYERVKDALLFNLLSYLSDQLLTKGNTVAALDELYLWLSNLTTIEYIRNCLKRVRKRNSALILASQNLEDFDIQGVRELTRPLFAIPTHQFLFHGGKVDKKFYMDNLQLESAEYDLISSPNNGVCLFKSGADRNLLDVHAPPQTPALIKGGGG